MAENEFLDLVSDLRGQLEEQIRLDEINKKILSTLDLDEILKEISESTCSLLNAERATVYVVQRNLRGDGKELISRSIVGDDVREIRLPFNRDSLAGFVAVTGKTICVNDVYDENELHAIDMSLHFDSSWDKKTGYRTRSMLVAPAVSRDRVVGVIQVLNKKDRGVFNTHDLELMTKLANYVGIALQNSQAHTNIIRRQRTRLTVDDMLVERGLIKEAQLKEAVERARQERKKLPEVLVEYYGVSEVEITKCLAELNNVEYLPFSPDMRINPDLFQNIPEAYAKRHCLCPYKQTLDSKTGELQLSLVMLNPKDFVAIEDIEIRTGAKVNKIYMSTRSEIQQMIQLALHPETIGKKEEEPPQEEIGELFSELAEDLGIKEEEEVEAVNIKQGASEDDAPIVRLCNRIIEDAYRMGGTDIHIEPMEKEVLVRVRRDGELEKLLTIPGHARNALVARYKIMADLNITEHRIPQDGRIRFKEHGGRYDIELRVNICPTVGGNEDIVMRILAASKPIPLPKLGLLPWVYEPFLHEIQKPYGMILCVGPTGSGKTTTLHSAVSVLNEPSMKILTAENPVEITQPGLRQVQIKNEVGLTFKEALRAFLRQDPDVILVGEMRDFETCSIAVEAALTGHLLFSTLHTNSAPETITRLVDIGIDPVTLSDALLCVLAQRLPRTYCKQCAVPGVLPQEILDQVHVTIENGMFKYLDKEFPVAECKVKGPGCEKCRGTGYAGRMGAHELLICTEEIKRMICSGAHVAEIREVAKQPSASGFRMYELFEDAVMKMLMGKTDLHQIRAVCAE